MFVRGGFWGVYSRALQILSRKTETTKTERDMGKDRDYRRFTEEEDRFIIDQLRANEKIKSIARCLNRDESEVSRRAGRLRIMMAKEDKRQEQAAAQVTEIMKRDLAAEAKEIATITTTNEERGGTTILSKFKPVELMLELKRRGYEGQLTYTEIKVHRINLSEL